MFRIVCCHHGAPTHFQPHTPDIYARNYVCSSVRVRWNCMWAECDISVKVVIFHPHWWSNSVHNPNMYWGEMKMELFDEIWIIYQRSLHDKVPEMCDFYLFVVLQHIVLSFRQCIDVCNTFCDANLIGWDLFNWAKEFCFKIAIYRDG